MSTTTPGYIGPFRLLNVVHTGHSSQIWQAYHDGDQKIYGIKMLLQKFRRNREVAGYLRWEAAVGQKLIHERVIHIHSYSPNRGNPYMSMEWFSAPNMKRLILAGIDRIAYLVPQIIEQAAEGLAYFNQMGWVHRDVKPDNFLVGDGGQVKLIDFALAQRSKSGLGKLLSPRTKVQGTRSYMAPEQIRGLPLDARADVYSLGCTIHELLGEKPPYTGVSADDLLRRHLKTSPPSLETFNRNVTPEFAQLVRRTLAKDPQDRPQSVDDFLTEFRMNRIFKRTPQPPDSPPVERQPNQG